MTSWYHAPPKPRRGLRVGEVARELDVTIPTVRAWSEQFPIPISRLNGQRYFPQKAVNRLRLVKFLLRTERYSVEDDKKRLREMFDFDSW